MTTIAVRDGIMACDSRETEDNGNPGDYGYIVTDKSVKIWRLTDGRIFGAAHDSEACLRLLHSLNAGEEAPDFGSAQIQALILNKDGSVELFEGSMWNKVDEPYYAIGSGARFAFAAMHMGGDACEAAAMGIRMDPNSGGAVQHLSIHE